MFGETYCCNQCEFNFCSGWSHHAGGQLLVCSQCSEYFILGGGASVWEPKLGEVLEYISDYESGKRRTGESATVERIDSNEGVMFLELDNTNCPNCQARDSLVQSFASNASCPKCKVGVVEKRGGCIY